MSSSGTPVRPTSAELSPAPDPHGSERHRPQAIVSRQPLLRTGRMPAVATPNDAYMALAFTVRDRV